MMMMGITVEKQGMDLSHYYQGLQSTLFHLLIYNEIIFSGINIYGNYTITWA